MPRQRAKQPATIRPLGEPARVLLVLDQPLVIEIIRLTLKHGVYTTRAVQSANEAALVLIEWQPHLVILDMDLDSLLVMQQIGTRAGGGLKLPVIGLTRRGDLRNKLSAFEAGVADILTIPFAPEELLARVMAVLRSSYSETATFTPVINLGELEIDILQRIVRAGTSEIHLSSLEQALLYLLAANAGQVVTREEILDTLWGLDYVADSKVVDREIRNLRTRLGDDARRQRFIVTVRDRGYRFLPTFTTAGNEAGAS